MRRGYGISLDESARQNRVQRSTLRVVQPALENAVADDVDAAGQSEPAHGIGLVQLYSLDTDLQSVRDLLVAMSNGYETKDLRFSFADGRPRPLRGIDPRAKQSVANPLGPSPRCRA